jgi:hypothetical protein
VITALVLVLAGASSAAPQDADRMTVALADPSRPATLDIALWAGVVNIVAGDDAVVVIDASATQGPATVRNSPPRASGLTRLRRPAEVEINEASNVVTIRGPAGERVDLEITVPRRSNLKLTKSAPGPTNSPGSVTVRGLDGDLEVRTNAGTIKFIDVSGSVVAHSTSGSVMASLQRVAPDRPMAFTSYQGVIDVTLPSTLRAKLILQSSRGSVFTDFEIQKQTGLLRRQTQAEGSSLGYRPIEAALNGGGPDIELRSYAANVYLRRGK